MKKEKKVVLYVRVQETNKKFAERQAKELNYGTLSEYVDTLFNNMRNRKEKAQKKKREQIKRKAVK